MINPEKRAGIRTTLAFIAISGFSMAACAPTSTPEASKSSPIVATVPLPESTATIISTSTSTSTSLPVSTPVPESTPRPTIAPVPVPRPTSVEASSDLQIQQTIERAKAGEVVVVRRGLVSHIARIPWFGGSADIATLSTNTSSQVGTNLVMSQADCLTKAFGEENTLGPEAGGGWKPNQRPEEMVIEIKTPVSVAVPVPFGDLKRVVYRDKTYICHEQTLGGQLRELLKRVNWKDAPENAGSTLRQLVDGFSRGYSRPTAPAK